MSRKGENLDSSPVHTNQLHTNLYLVQTHGQLRENNWVNAVIVWTERRNQSKIERAGIEAVNLRLSCCKARSPTTSSSLCFSCTVSWQQITQITQKYPLLDQSGCVPVCSWLWTSVCAKKVGKHCDRATCATWNHSFSLLWWLSFYKFYNKCDSEIHLEKNKGNAPLHNVTQSSSGTPQSNVFHQWVWLKANPPPLNQQGKSGIRVNSSSFWSWWCTCTDICILESQTTNLTHVENVALQKMKDTLKTSTGSDGTGSAFSWRQYIEVEVLVQYISWYFWNFGV